MIVDCENWHFIDCKNCDQKILMKKESDVTVCKICASKLAFVCKS